jgi:hypothetical protein
VYTIEDQRTKDTKQILMIGNTANANSARRWEGSKQSKGLCGIYIRTNEPPTKLNLSAEQVHGNANVNGDRLPP